MKSYNKSSYSIKCIRCGKPVYTLQRFNPEGTVEMFSPENLSKEIKMRLNSGSKSSIIASTHCYNCLRESYDILMVIDVRKKGVK